VRRAGEIGVTTSPAKRVLLVCTGVAAALLYANFLLDWVLRGFEGMGEIVSLLEAPGQPNATVLRVTDVVCAVLVVALLPWVRRRLPPGPWREVVVASTVVFALGAVVAAIVATPCGPGAACDGPGQQLRIDIHDGSSIVSDTALYVGVAAAWLATRRPGPRWFNRTAWWLFWIGGIVSTIVFEWFSSTGNPPWAVGASQRLHIVCISLWILTLAVLAADVLPHGRAGRPDTHD
jgi:hypothetical protein